MMRSETLHNRLVKTLQSGALGIIDMLSVDLQKLPVAAKDEPKKKALLRELGEIDRRHDVLMRRVRAFAGRLERLPVVKTLV